MLWDAPSASGTQKEKAATQFCSIRNLEVLQNTPVTLAPPPSPEGRLPSEEFCHTAVRKQYGGRAQIQTYRSKV